MSKEIKDQWDVLVQTGSGEIDTCDSTATQNYFKIKLSVKE
jgi:hypothetical protein